MNVPASSPWTPSAVYNKLSGEPLRIALHMYTAPSSHTVDAHSYIMQC